MELIMKLAVESTDEKQVTIALELLSSNFTDNIMMAN